MNFHQRVTQWAHDRNLIEGATPQMQFLKLTEELSEISDDPVDGIGDASVVVVVMCGQLGHTEEELQAALEQAEVPHSLIDALGRLAAKLARNQPCLPEIATVLLDIKFSAETLDLDYDKCCEVAWEEIKNRKGEMRGGVFVKEADL